MIQSLSSLKHTTRTLPTGGEILVLDTGALIPAESEAMLQALHSRSVGGIKEHLKVLEKNGPEKFISTFYVGYGHKSIGDCGTGTIFIEGVSMLVAKAIQDWQLYSGQEASTRYIDFSSQAFIDPIGSPETQKMLEKWRTFYLKGVALLPFVLMKRFPIQDGENEKTYKKAINARVFDIMRSFLPAGASTNLSWHSNLRQMADKLILLRNHPLEEVREVAFAMEDALMEVYPSSFSKKRYEDTEKYVGIWMQQENYFHEITCQDFELVRNGIDCRQLRDSEAILRSRPSKTELPKFIAECGTLQFSFLLDFGSFRDIQRHRSVIQRMPLVTNRHGFGEWYLSELPQELCKEAKSLLREQKTALFNLSTTKEIGQYFIAMGYNLPNRLTGSLPALVYLVELRATRFVHPTLRKRAQQIAKVIEKKFGEYGLVLHLDNEPDRFDIKRGEQDIIQID